MFKIKINKSKLDILVAKQIVVSNHLYEIEKWNMYQVAKYHDFKVKCVIIGYHLDEPVAALIVDRDYYEYKQAGFYLNIYIKPKFRNLKYGTVLLNKIHEIYPEKQFLIGEGIPGSLNFFSKFNYVKKID